MRIAVEDMPVKPTPAPRLQIELSVEKLRELERLQEDTGLATKKDLVNNALTLLTWAVEEAKDGRKIVSVDDRGKRHRELVMPALRHATSTVLSR